MAVMRPHLSAIEWEQDNDLPLIVQDLLAFFGPQGRFWLASGIKPVFYAVGLAFSIVGVAGVILWDNLSPAIMPFLNQLVSRLTAKKS